MSRSSSQLRWKPHLTVDRALAAVLNLAYLVVYIPFHICHLLLGWTRMSWILLDLLSFPGVVARQAGKLFGGAGRLWGLRTNALVHTHLVCRLCPPARRALRDVDGSGRCAWNRRWNEEEFEIPPDFGLKNYLTQFAGHTDLDAYRDLADRLPPNGSSS